MPINKQLTLKQQSFVDYLTDTTNKQTYNNALESARAAGYKGNDNTLTVIGSQNLTKLNVKLAVTKVKAEIRAESDYNRGQGEKDYEQVRLLALDKGDLQAANTAIRGKNKLYALETDKVLTPDLIPVQQMNEAEQQALTDIARAYKVKLAKGLDQRKDKA